MPVKDKDNFRRITFVEALREAMVQSMKKDDSVLALGLGVTDPKGVFGTTLGLEEEFGEERVYDIPVSENAVTGICVGLAISGFRPILSHQRADFILMSMDQIINNSAKWNYMYGGQTSVPLVIRTIVGRGWGQGPQHSQNFQAMFAQVPGLKVVSPTTPYQAKGLMIAAIEDPDPVIFVEHRWLHGQIGNVPKDYYSIPIGKANVMHQGKDITVVTSLDMAVETLNIAECIKSQKIDIEVIDLCTVKPLDEQTILDSVRKTGRLLVIDSSWKDFGVGSQVTAMVAEKGHEFLKSAIRRMGLPDIPSPSSPALSKSYYPRAKNICQVIEEMLGVKIDISAFEEETLPHDVPDSFFKGPF
jgi:acetoin:2,6-dichlorophenolindophenol oxidoreductase subunit beta